MTTLPVSHPSQAADPAFVSAVSHRDTHARTTRILGALITLLIMLILKRHYSLATAHQLDWILAPTARLVAWLTCAHPVYEGGVGYVDFSRGIIVAPACAGVNFMIMAFGLAAVHVLARIHRLGPLLAWLATAMCAAYAYTLGVNAVRIALSMDLYIADIYNGWLTMARVHRLAGIGLYVSALWLLHAGLGWAAQRYGASWDASKGRGLPDWLPLGWYVAGTVGVPLVHMILQQRAPTLGEHGLTIGITAAVLWGGRKWMRHLCKTQ